MPHLILYDGVCGLCNRLNRFVLARDRTDGFRFAPLQGKVAGDVLAKYAKDPADLDTFYLVTGWGSSGERLLWRGRAALQVLRELGGIWGASRVLGLLPTVLLDLGYRIVARSRYRLFGRHAVCPVPSPEHRAKFLLDGAPTGS
ncbi:MAG: DUF393 domain-containing protein [Planctomycetes bacterium]|nr:DUF393 domain-containing protein [Planctomycetota bacterium]